MRRISLGILAAVGLFVVVVAGSMIVRSRSVRVEPEEPPSKADFRIKEVQLEEQSGDIRWKLVADQAEVFEGAGRTGLRRPVVDIHQPNRSWRVRGDEGDVLQQSKDIEVRKNVILVSDDGLRLETTVLRWQAATKRLWTDAPVRITRDGTAIEGLGLVVNMNLQTAQVGGRVRAEFAKFPRMAPAR
jgi:LPS export ABC transporter protein LptC